MVRLLSVPTDNAELLKAQYMALSRQVPMMYFILMTSTWAVAITHMATAPLWLTAGIPSVFTLVTGMRIWQWRTLARIEPSVEIALKALKRTNRLAIVITVAFTFWSYLLYPYGDAYAQSHLAFYMSITVISCIFCLMHLRSAAFLVAAIVNGSFVIFFSLSGQPTFVAIAVNVVLVSAGMLTILMINYNNFAEMVNARIKTEALSNENLRLANIDSLTGLPNRRAFFSDLQKTFETANAQDGTFAIGILDLDGFKPVNDIYGHSAGDRLLVQVAERLQTLQDLNNVAFYRLGGDEFALLAAGPIGATSAMMITEEICTALQRMFTLAAAKVQISGSVGIALYPDSAETPEDLFDKADYALYHGKRSRRGCGTLFTKALDAQIHREALIEQMLRQADLEEELSVVFQPIVDVTDRHVVGFEALARWHNPVLGQVSPAQFIPIAERADFIGKLTRTLLKKALATAESWPENIRLSFNLSARDLNTEEGVLAITTVLRKSAVSPRRIDFEITETSFAHDFEQVCMSIGLLRLLGCGISLDYFGTGYSSLTRLHALPLTKIKIDRSFVQNLHIGPASYKIIKSLLALSRDMELDCVVEGVETQRELDTLKDLGVTLIQGFYYSPPLPAGELGPFLEAPKPRMQKAG